MDYNSLSGLDKAAILFQVLGEPLAVSFFSGVSKEKLMQVRVRSNELAGKIREGYNQVGWIPGADLANGTYLYKITAERKNGSTGGRTSVLQVVK